MQLINLQTSLTLPLQPLWLSYEAATSLLEPGPQSASWIDTLIVGEVAKAPELTKFKEALDANTLLARPWQWVPP